MLKIVIRDAVSQMFV